MGDPTPGTYNGGTDSHSGCKGKLVHGLERLAEFAVAGWLMINTLGMALVTLGVARRYIRTVLERRQEAAREVVFDPALTLTE
jgi:hypothetical protein